LIQQRIHGKDFIMIIRELILRFLKKNMKNIFPHWVILRIFLLCLLTLRTIKHGLKTLTRLLNPPNVGMLRI